MLFDGASQVIDVFFSRKTTPARTPFLFVLSLGGCSTVFYFDPKHLIAYAGGR
jgi:hypothetical protein